MLTGANGAGKTSILAFLGRHFNWQSQFVALPFRDDAGNLDFSAGLREELIELLEGETSPIFLPPEYRSAGSISYSDGTSSAVGVPTRPGIVYDPIVLNQQFVPGLYIPSHRQLSGYQRVDWMPTSFAATDQILENFLNEVRQKYYGQQTGRSNMYLMKEALLAAANYGLGNEAFSTNPEARSVWLGFQEVVQRLMPETLQFDSFRIEPPDVIVRTGLGDFPIDAVSGGISAILELAWQVFLRSRNHEDFTVLLDEPENHLHPSLQRQLMPGLLAAFPEVRFIVATHSPFVVTAEPTARVYALDYYGEEGVKADELDFANKAASAEETLTEVLGVRSTVPIWAEDRYNAILQEYLSLPLDASSIRNLRSRFVEEGLSAYLPTALASLTAVLDDSDSAS